MDFFDDALSEDWISQPGSSGPGSVRGDSPLSHKGSVTASSTRAHRRDSKNGSSGFLESRHTGSRRNPPALGERRPSQLNSKNVASISRLAKASANGNDGLASSPHSSLVLRQGTVLQNEKSRAEKQDNNPTPEWKRRLLAGRSKLGQQKDLFSSTSTAALENAFTAPEASDATDEPAAKSKTPAALQQVGKSRSPVTAVKKNSLDKPAKQKQSPLKGGSPSGSLKAPASKAVEPKSNPTQAPTESPGAFSSKRKPEILDPTLADKTRPGDVSQATSALQQLVDQDFGSSAPSSRQASTADPYRFVTYARGNINSDVTSLDRNSDLDPVHSPEETDLNLSLPEDESITQRPPSPKTVESPSRSGGSPLKLFGKYDTYTNDRIARRVNQLADNDAEGTTEPDVRRNESFSAILPKGYGQLAQSALPKNHRAISNFGQGELDEFSFDHQDTSSIELDHRPRVVTSRSVSDSHVSARLSSRRMSRMPSLANSANLDAATESMNPSMEVTNDEGKRLLNSPRRVPEAKRRRTSPPLPDWDDGTLEKPERQYREIDYIAGRKRKDARYDNNYPTASPDVIASRRMLQPKGPYSLRRRTSKSGIDESVEYGEQDESIVLDLAKYADDSEDEATQNGQGVRKKSVTTADFFMEANLIMRNIRAQAQPSASPTRGPSDEIDPPVFDASYNEEFTMEQLSRPASREGSYRRRPQGMFLNARVVSHLRKFEEKDDVDYSIAQINEESLLSDDVHSDPPNIRIRNSRVHEMSRSEDGAATNRFESQSSSDHATEKSLPTESSGGSAPKATISPDKVSHLLSRTMGGMTFDENKGCWVKTRLSGTAKPTLEAGFVNDAEDDDPFNAIPDLTIDESQEILAVRGLIRQTSSTRAKHRASDQGGILQPEMLVEAEETTEPRGDETSSIISKYTHFASSGPAVETRATSWGDVALRRSKSEYDMRTNAQQTASSQRTMSGRLHVRGVAVCEGSPRGHNNSSVNALRLSTGRPEPVNWTCGSPGAKSDGEIDYAELSIGPDEEDSTRYAQKRQLSRIDSATSSQLFDPDQENKDPKESRIAVVPSANQLERALSTPRTESRFDKTMLIPSSAGRGVGDLQLTPLPDFTIHQPDESLQLDVGYVARRHGLSSRNAVEGQFSLAIRELVSKIQDVEPHEPYWEFLRTLDLRKRNLLTLHMLNEFCSRVEDLNVSDNQLGQLNGAPSSVQVLSIRNNCLSNLTAFYHLPNLQYVDVSGNTIASLKPFKGLIHLRELNIELNDIEDTDGLEGMSQLISLKIGHNRIKTLDLRNANLPRLITLDAHNNSIHEVRGLSRLSALQDLNLRHNELIEFALDPESLSRSLQHLDLSMNQLDHLDLTEAPCLKSLAVDYNRIAILEGLDALRSVEAVSWSHQGTPTSRTSIQIECCAQTQFLNLSGNSLTNFEPKVQFLNLRRLELASCGLEVLGADLGAMMPNLRVINLNDNGLKDIRPLLGIAMLEELHLARNRISRLRLTASILHRFASTMRVLDLRENPLTLAFYPPVRPNQLVSSERDTSVDTACRDCDRSCSTAFLNMIPTDESDDDDYQTRLDEETLLRRRVYEALVLCHCTALDNWDGMAMEKRRFVDAEVTWTRLVELGVLKRKQAKAG